VTHDPLPTVPCDQGQIVQLLQNLIGNAIKYRNGEAPEVHVSCQRHGNEWVFSVKDNGIGIPVNRQEQIFQIFRRLHARDSYGGGTGVGLTIAKKIVERHGGRLWVESEPSVGSTFYIALPDQRL